MRRLRPLIPTLAIVTCAAGLLGTEHLAAQQPLRQQPRAQPAPARGQARPAAADPRFVTADFVAVPVRDVLARFTTEHGLNLVQGVALGTEPVTASFHQARVLDATEAVLLGVRYEFQRRPGDILIVTGRPNVTGQPAVPGAPVAPPRLEDVTPASEVATQPIAAEQRGESVKPGINDGFLDPELDVTNYVRRFEVESREVFVHRQRIASALGLQPGMAIADIGAGTGAYLDLFARGVGEEGKVYAVDLSPRFIEHLTKRVAERGYEQAEVVRCTEDSAELPPQSVDRVFICDTYHHFEYPERTMASILAALRPGGELVMVDFDRIPGVSRDWMLGHVRAGRDVVCAELASFGFEFVDFVAVPGLRENYVVRFRRPRD